LAEYPAAASDRQAPVASPMAAYRKIPGRHRPSGVGRSATIQSELERLDHRRSQFDPNQSVVGPASVL